jgi:deazaflavin-dependent oxidoreductase (nitroreductase family)
MDHAVREALGKGGVIDITTTGRKTGAARRIEINFFNADGKVYITGIPIRPRSWYANLRAHPEFTFHLKQGVTADLPARATPITDEATRRKVLTPVAQRVSEQYRQQYSVDDWVQRAPLVSVDFS